jgi:AcrR family transcriptional regulator
MKSSNRAGVNGVIETEQESGWSRRRNILLSRYELIAWELFAQHGFREVTVDAIAEAAGVSARTLFRYFPAKEDFLLGYIRRGTNDLVETIAHLETSDTPLQRVLQLLHDNLLENPPDIRILNLWRAAAADAPEVHARVRGERMHDLTDAVARYCGESMGITQLDDPQPRLLAGIVVGIESATIEMLGRTDMTVSEILLAVDALIPTLGPRNMPRRTRR